MLHVDDSTCTDPPFNPEFKPFHEARVCMLIVQLYVHVPLVAGLAVLVVLAVAMVLLLAVKVLLDGVVVESHPLHVLSHLSPTPSHKACVKIM